MTQTQARGFRSALVAIIFAGMSAVSPAAFAQNNQTIRLISGFPPGTATDILARTIAAGMSGPLGQTVIVDSRPGASGQMATAYVAKAPADGSVLTFGNVATHGSLLATRHLPYGIDDFTYIAMITSTPLSLLASTKTDIHDLKSLIAYSKSHNKPILFGSGGINTPAHLAALLLAQKAGVAIEHVPYNSTAAVTALASGDIQLLFEVANAKTAVENGSARMVGVAGDHRWTAFPEVPTFEEQGLKNFRVLSWFGIMGPANMPPETVTKLENAIHAAFADPKFIRTLENIGYEVPKDMTRQDFVKFVHDDYARWKEIVATNHISIE